MKLISMSVPSQAVLSASVVDIESNKAKIWVLKYVISDSGKYSGFGYPDIQIPVEITNCNLFLSTGYTGYFSPVIH